MKKVQIIAKAKERAIRKQVVHKGITIYLRRHEHQIHLRADSPDGPIRITVGIKQDLDKFLDTISRKVYRVRNKIKIANIAKERAMAPASTSTEFQAELTANIKEMRGMTLTKVEQAQAENYRNRFKQTVPDDMVAKINRGPRSDADQHLIDKLDAEEAKKPQEPSTEDLMDSKMVYQAGASGSGRKR